MRIALLNVIRPQPGSGDGMTECAYQLYLRLRRHNRVDFVYPLERSKRVDVIGLTYATSLFKRRIARIASEPYDVIHIANQELGFAAKVLKRAGAKTVITTVYDLMRVRKGYNKGLLQKAYDSIVAAGIQDAVDYSDCLIFSCKGVQNDMLRMFNVRKPFKTMLIGQAKDSFRRAKIPNKANGSVFSVGYIGAISHRKNVAFILRTAKLLRGSDYRFTIYGSGPDYDGLVGYKRQNKLDNVSLMGFAPENRLMRIYDGFDLFFYPTLEEGTSLPVFDAQARGLPVLLYKGNHLTEEVTKYCFTAKSESDAARLIRRIKENGYDRGRRSRARTYVGSFTWGRVAKETLDVYKTAISRSRST